MVIVDRLKKTGKLKKAAVIRNKIVKLKKKLANILELNVTGYSDDAVNLIKTYEGFVPIEYQCPAGQPTIGYGHQILTGESFVQPMREDQASDLLFDDLDKLVPELFPHITVHLTQGEYDALCSLVYNWGIGNFLQSKGFQLLNQKDYDGARYQFFSKEAGVVNINGVFSQGLYNRRQAEQAVWDK